MSVMKVLEVSPIKILYQDLYTFYKFKNVAQSKIYVFSLFACMKMNVPK